MAEEKQPQRIRVQFDFSAGALEKLDALVEKAEAKSRAEVVRSALRFYDWFSEQFAGEKEIIIRRVSNGEEMLVPVSILFFTLASS